jgi:cytochrome c553
MKYIIFTFIALSLFACNQTNSTEKADMYEASELSAMMREMVVWSKSAKATLAAGDTIQEVPQSFYDLAKQKATRGEHDEAAFQAMVPAYTDALRGIERQDSQQYYYTASIQACRSCHGVYCGGPLDVIDQL